MNHADVQPMPKPLLDVAELIIMSEYTEATAERCHMVAIEKKAEKFMTYAKDIQETQVQHGKIKIFNFPLHKSVIITN